MTLASLSDVLIPAYRQGYAVAGLVVLGWEDARAYVAAAEAAQSPVILQAGPGCRKHTPLPVLAAMFRALADGASVPVVAHLDHGYTVDECAEAIDCGFTSVMFDGSQKPLADNVRMTSQIVNRAHAAGVSVEGEIGFVGYAGGVKGRGTTPEEAEIFARDSGVDAMAVSVGNVHLQTEQGAVIDRQKLAEIEAVTNVPLVLHGGSGIPEKDRHTLATQTAICKFNIGTELRQAFGSALRAEINNDPEVFDRIAILSAIEPSIQTIAEGILKNIQR